MMNTKQEQSASGGAVALQASRDIHYNGMTFSEVKELVEILLRDNFPKLKEEARQVAENNVRAFSEILEKKIVNDIDKIVVSKFSDPDVQATINDAVQASARKGEFANPAILTNLIAERVSKKTSHYKDIVVSEATNVVPRLTYEQVALISFVHFVTSVNLKNLQHVNGIERFAQAVFPLISPGFNLSISQHQHIQYTGAASISKLLGGDIYKAVSETFYPHLAPDGHMKFREDVLKHAPTYALLLNQFDSEKLFSITLTSVGQAIAIANLSRTLGEIDYTIWLK